MKKLICFLVFLFTIQIMLSEEIEVPQQKLPAWIYNIPQNCTIGISKKSLNAKNMVEASKQFAVVQNARNSSSNIRKVFLNFASGYGNSTNYDRYKSEINVVADKELLKKEYKCLRLLEYDFLNNYLLVLYSKSDSLKNEISTKPFFPKKDSLLIEKDFVVSIASATSSDLIKAWEKSLNQARIKIGDYLNKQVNTVYLTDGNVSKKAIKVLSAKTLNKIILTNANIEYFYVDSNLSYRVYTKLYYKMEN